MTSKILTHSGYGCSARKTPVAIAAFERLGTGRRLK
jgi:hypothetical protein